MYSIIIRLDEFGFDSFECKYFLKGLSANLYSELVSFLCMIWDLGTVHECVNDFRRQIIKVSV